KMEDVIFSGSDARKPGGAAEVRLRLSGLPLPPKPVADTPAHPSTTEPFRLDGPEAVPGHEDAGTNGHGNGNGHGTGNGNGNGNGSAHAPAPVPVLASSTLGME